MHATKEFDNNEPTIDALGGATLTTTAQRIHFDNRQLRTLDVRDCPDLHTLNLRDCQPGLHVTVANAPALRILVLPQERPGSVIHLDAGSSVPKLAVRGLIDELDACWEDGHFRLASQGRPPWWGATINDASYTDAEALVWSDPHTSIETALPSMERLRELRLIGLNLPSRLALRDHVLLEAVTIHRCDGAQAIQVPDGIHSFDINHHPGLERIDGAGHALRMRECHTDELTITGLWWQILVDGGRLRHIRAEQVESITLTRVPLMRDLTVREGARFASSGPIAPTIHANGLCDRPHAVTRLRGLDHGIERMLHTLGETGGSSWDGVASLLTRPAKGAEWLHRLRALEANIGTVRPERLWRLRCLMHAAQQTRKPRKITVVEALAEAGKHWNWRFPADDAPRGYAADLHLAEVALGQPEAAEFFTLLEHVHDERHLGALADRVYQARRCGHAPPEVFVTALSRGIAKACRILPKRRRQVAAPTVHGLVRGAVLINDSDAAENLRAFTNAYIDPARRSGILRTLTEHGCTAARTDVWMLATTLPAGRERETAQRAALAPVRSQALASNEQEVIHE